MLHFDNFRRCRAVIDPENPLPLPENETEWLDMFTQYPAHDRRGLLLHVKNRNIVVIPRN